MTVPFTIVVLDKPFDPNEFAIIKKLLASRSLSKTGGPTGFSPSALDPPPSCEQPARGEEGNQLSNTAATESLQHDAQQLSSKQDAIPSTAVAEEKLSEEEIAMLKAIFAKYSDAPPGSSEAVLLCNGTADAPQQLEKSGRLLADSDVGAEVDVHHVA